MEHDQGYTIKRSKQYPLYIAAVWENAAARAKVACAAATHTLLVHRIIRNKHLPAK